MINRVCFYIIITSFISCTNEASNKLKEEIKIKEEIKHNRYFEDLDSLGKIKGSYYLDDENLFDGEMLLFFPNGKVRERFLLKKDTIIGYVTEKDSLGRLSAYKNYKKPLIEKRGDLNEIIFYDSLGSVNKEKSIYIDMTDCFFNKRLLDLGKVKVFPVNVDSVKFQIKNTSEIVKCKGLGNQLYSIDFKNNMLKKYDTLEFYIYDSRDGSNFVVEKIISEEHLISL